MHTTTLARRFAIAFVAGALVFLALDAVWLATMAERLYRPAIGHLMREGFDAVAAALFYLLYLSGMTLFAVWPSQRARGAWARGALFGLVAYATYDLTNQATLRDWPWTVTLIDLAWGSVVTSLAATAAYAAMSAFEPRANR